MLMNKLSRDTRANVLGMMVEGVSLRSISRLTGASKNTVAKMLEDAGKAFTEYQMAALVNLPSLRIQVDEIWSFTHCKQKTSRTPRPHRKALATRGRGRRSTPTQS